MTVLSLEDLQLTWTFFFSVLNLQERETNDKKLSCIMTLRKQLLIYSDFYHFSESQYDAMSIDIQDED